MKIVLSIHCIHHFHVFFYFALVIVSIIVLIYNNTETTEQLELNKAFSMKLIILECVRLQYKQHDRL